MGRRSTADLENSTSTELEVFATGSTVAVAPHAAAGQFGPGGIRPELGNGDAATLTDRLRHGGELVRDGVEQAREFRARPGHRPGAAPVLASTAGSRTGGLTDIVRPVLVSPRFAGEFAVSGGLFDEPIPHLSISHRRDATGKRFLMWDGELDTGGDSRRVTFHLLASPSMLVTVLELVPRRRLRVQRRQFVSAGVAAVEVIAHRLERAARPLCA